MTEKMFKKLLVVVPAYNEEEKISDVLSGIPRKIKGLKKIEILVVDDGSTDKTVKIARKLKVSVISHPYNLGLGSVFDTSQTYVIDFNFDLMVMIDGDGQFNSLDIQKLIFPIIEGKADFVTASRFIDKNFYPQMPKIKFLGNKLMSRLISSLAGKRFFDVSCGFRAYSREALLSLNLHGQFTYTQESFFNLAFKKMRIVEVPVKVKYYQNRQSRVASNIPKYMINTLKIILKTYRDYRPFAFFSRIAMFFLFLGIVFSTILLYTFISRGTFSPNIWSGFVGAAFFFMALALLIVGLLADMNTRIRLNQEKILYFLKKQKSNK